MNLKVVAMGLALGLVPSSGFAQSAQTSAVQHCGTQMNACKTSLGEYSIRLPDGDGGVDNGRVPALLYFHGAGGSGPRAMRNEGMIEAFLARGYAVIAPSGLKRPNSRFGPGWSFLPFREKQRDELSFAREVLGDAASRFGIDRARVMMGGFSIGGSLTWYLACEDPTIARAFVPVGGAFWRPHPKSADCAGPLRMFHTHGWRDGTVPLEGRPLGGGRIYQGDVFHGLELLREVNGCDGLRADQFDTQGRYWQRWWSKCRPGTALRFALHPGGHSVPKGWAEMVINWFEELEG
ncbi:MAG: polyhydroxybutyrate depolymerase [Pseudomonadota bacterium]